MQGGSIPHRAPPRKEPFRPAPSAPCGTPVAQDEEGRQRSASRGAKVVHRGGIGLHPVGQIRRLGEESGGHPPKACRQWPPCPGQQPIAPPSSRMRCEIRILRQRRQARMWRGRLHRLPVTGSATGERSAYRTRRREHLEEYPPAESERRQRPHLSGKQLRIVKRAPQEEPHRRVTIRRHRLAPEERRLDRPLPIQSSTLRDPGNEPGAPPRKPCLWFDTPISCRQPIPISRAQRSIERPSPDSSEFCPSSIGNEFSVTKLASSFGDRARNSRLRR